MQSIASFGIGLGIGTIFLGVRDMLSAAKKKPERSQAKVLPTKCAASDGNTRMADLKMAAVFSVLGRTLSAAKKESERSQARVVLTKCATIYDRYGDARLLDTYLDLARNEYDVYPNWTWINKATAVAEKAGTFETHEKRIEDATICAWCK